MPYNFGGKSILEVLPHPDAYSDRWKEYEELAKKEHGLEDQMSLLNERLEIYRETNEDGYDKLLDTLAGFERVLENVSEQKKAAYKSFSLALKAIIDVRKKNKEERAQDQSF